MNPDPATEPADDTANPMAQTIDQPEGDAAATALQQAIRERSIDTLNADQARPPAPLSHRLLILGLTLGAMLVFVVLINFAVTGMRKILDVWYPGSISGRSAQPARVEPPPLGPNQPFYITVDPPLEETGSREGASSASSSAASNAGR